MALVPSPSLPHLWGCQTAPATRERLCPPGSSVAGEGQPHTRRSEATHLSAAPVFFALRLSQVPGKRAEQLCPGRLAQIEEGLEGFGGGGSMPTGSGRKAGKRADAATLRARGISADAPCPTPSWHLGWGEGRSPGGAELPWGRGPDVLFGA